MASWLAYLTVDGRERQALLGTLFRFAQFFGWTEICFGYFDRLRFADDKSTKLVATTLKALGRTLAVDRLDRADPADAATTRLMIWREEQRAIGELMRADGDPPRCISFNSFTQRYEAELATWFSSFASQVDQVKTPSSERLAEVQRLLARLVCELDIDGLLVKRDGDGVVTAPRWAQPRLVRAFDA